MSDWIKIHDSEWTPARITAQIASRAKTREVELGPLEVSIATSSFLEGAPQPAQDRPYNATLYNHLKLLNEMPLPDVAPVLADSTATGTSWLGGMWQRVRVQFHELVLFYVNRAARQQNQFNSELIAALNELTRSIEDQQEEIQHLKAEQVELQDQREDK